MEGPALLWTIDGKHVPEGFERASTTNLIQSETLIQLSYARFLVLLTHFLQEEPIYLNLNPKQNDEQNYTYIKKIVQIHSLEKKF